MATVHKTQLSLKRKVEIAQDLSKGMTQLDAVKSTRPPKVLYLGLVRKRNDG